MKPPATSTTSGGKNKETHSGQTGVPYGFRHELSVKPSHKSEMAHHFHAHRPGDEKANDEPG
jgi:hypothetical protein